MSAPSATAPRRDIINEMYPDEQARVEQVLRAALDAGQKRELDRLDSYHLYGPKFTKFDDGDNWKITHEHFSPFKSNP